MFHTYDNNDKKRFDDSFRQLAKEAIALKIAGPWHDLTEMHDDIEMQKKLRTCTVGSPVSVKVTESAAETGRYA